MRECPHLPRSGSVQQPYAPDSALRTFGSGVVGFEGLLVVQRGFIGHSAARVMRGVRQRS